ncbi:helix-hairpin-helix domain-containing protein [Lacrimispora sp. 38-1]|uniref:helix-hairpin-helix domain-containing protein n=1 Tax=Lacrimispora sp. 38-1 TaxID=3125778 RepID=UPI003CEBB1CD
MNYHRIKIAAIAICVIICSICYGLNRNHIYPEEKAFVSIQEPPVSSMEETPASDSLKAPEEPSRICYVHICGEVVSPGVYELEEGSRIFQAVAVAGGFTENAAADTLNMAEQVKDGMKIQVPDQEEAKRLLDQGTSSLKNIPEGSHKVNLNTAGKEELMTLRGVGEAKADDIIRYRESHGGFQKIEDIMKISGIKEAAFQKIKDDITV